MPERTVTKLQELMAQLDTIVQALRVEIAEPTPTTVRTGGELRAALSAGVPSIALVEGPYLGNFLVTKPTRLQGPREAFLIPLDQFQPTLSVQSSDVTVQGLTIRNGAPDRECVVVGSLSATDAARQPSRVTFNGVAVEAGPRGGQRGLALHGAFITVQHSRVTNFWDAGRESQGIWVHNGPGPYTLVDNYIEASGENIMVGGETVKIPGCVPADILIRGNTCYKPDAWRGVAKVKNGIEVKMGRRVVIEDNVVDGNWRSGQDGAPFVITTRNQNNDSPWVVIDDVILRGNRTVRCADYYAVSILGRDNNYPSGQTTTILIEHNLFADSPQGFLIGNGVAADLTIRRNTLPAITGNFLAFYDSATPPRIVTPLTFVDNVLKHGEYGMNGSNNYPYPFPLIVTFKAFTGNVIERDPRRDIAKLPGNTWVGPGELATLLDPTTLKFKIGTAGY